MTRATLTPGAELELVAGDGRAHPAADEPGLDAVGGQRADELLACRVDLALVLAQLLRLRAGARSAAAPTRPAPAPRRRPAGGARSGRLAPVELGLGVERDVDVGVVRVGRARPRSPASGTTGVGTRRGGHRQSSTMPSGAMTNGLPRHSSAAVRPVAGHRRAGPGRPTAEEDTGGDQDGHQRRRRPAARRRRRCRGRHAGGGPPARRDTRRLRAARASRTASACPWPARPGRRCRGGRARCRPRGARGPAPAWSSSSSYARGGAVEQQRDPGADGDEREEDAGPAGERRQPGVGRRGRRDRAAGPTAPGPRGRRA